MMGRPRNYARDAAIVAAYQRGETAAAIGRRQSPPVSEAAITAILRRLNVPTRHGRQSHARGRAPLPVVGPDGTVYGASLAEAARYLGVSYQALRTWGEVRDGVLYLHRVSARREREREAGSGD